MVVDNGQSKPKHSKPHDQIIELLGLQIEAGPRLAGRPQLLPHLGIYYTGGDMLPVLRSCLKTYPVEDFLCLVSRVSSLRTSRRVEVEQEFAKLGVRPEQVLRDYQFSLMVRVLLEDEQERRSRNTQITLTDLIRCSELVTNVLCSADTTLSTRVPGQGWSLIHRIAYQQFPDQEADQYLPRALVIFRQIAASLEGPFSFQLDNAYQGKYGLTLADLWFMGFGLYSWVIGNPGKPFRQEVLTGSEEFKGLTAEKVRRFFGLVSCNYDQYRKNLDVPSTGKEGFEPYNLNPLLRWPILLMSSGEYILPLPRYLLQRASSGIYYDFVGEDQSRFGNILGRAFELYVGKILEGLPGVPQLLPEREYQLDGQVSTTCEWIILDDDTAVLVECKTRALNALAKITGDGASIRKDLARPHGVVDGIKKLQAVKSAIERRAVGLEPFHNVGRIFGLLVTLDDFYLPNSPFIRGIINEELSSQGQPPIPWEFQLLHVGGLEWLSSLLAKSNVSIGYIMDKKVNHTTFRDWDFKNFVPEIATELALGASVGSWHKVLEEALHLFTGELATQFRQ